MAVSLADRKRQFFEDNTGLTGKSLNDLEWSYYSARSGLTPAGFYSVADHKRKFYENETGLSGISMTALERAYYEKQGFTSGSLADRAFSFFDFNPLNLPNLELALSADKIIKSDADPVAIWPDLSGKGRHVTQSDQTKQPLFRNANPNLLTYEQATCSGLSGVGSANASSLSVYTADSYLGGSCIRVDSPTALTNPGLITGPIKTPIQSNKEYSFLGRVKRGVGSRPLLVRVEYQDSNSAYAGGTDATLIETDANGWSLYQGSFIAPANAVYAYLYTRYNGTVVAGDWYLTDTLQLEKGPTPTAWVPPVTLPNNLPAVQFDGVNDILTCIPENVSQPATIYVVCTPQNAGTQKRVAASIFLLASSLYAIYAGTTVSSTGSVAVLEKANVICGIVNDANSLISVDGSTVRGSTGTGLVEFGNVGARGGAVEAEWFSGPVSAVYIYFSAHDDATRKRIEQYLGRKYGIAVAV